METGALNDAKLLQVDEKISKLPLPSDIGRMARKVSICYKSMKADEWKHWTLVYQVFALRGILNQRDLRLGVCLFKHV